MGHSEVWMSATLHEATSSNEAIGIPDANRSKLGDAAAVLWTEVARQNHALVLHQHVPHLQRIMQASSERAFRQTILEELSTNESITEAT